MTIKIIVMKLRTTIFLFLFIGLGLTSRADGVSENQARQLAAAFFYERLSQYQTLSPDDISIRSTYLEKSGETPVYFVFNMSPDGFIAISAVASAHPVLCYSFRGAYSLSHQPDNFRAWMKQYRDALAFSAANPVAGAESHPLWDRYTGRDPEPLSPFSGRDRLPMLTTTWDQGSYYNEMCPADPLGPSGHCVTGCVATTLAQLMNYVRWPDSGTGS